MAGVKKSLSPKKGSPKKGGSNSSSPSKSPVKRLSKAVHYIKKDEVIKF